MLVNKIRTFLVCIVVLHVKLLSQWIKIVEMRAKSVWWVKIRCFTPQFSPPKFLTKKHVNLSNFWDILQYISHYTIYSKCPSPPYVFVMYTIRWPSPPRIYLLYIKYKCPSTPLSVYNIHKHYSISLVTIQRFDNST